MEFQHSTFSTATGSAQNMKFSASGSALLSSSFCLVIILLSAFKTSHHVPTKVFPGTVKCFWWFWSNLLSLKMVFPVVQTPALSCLWQNIFVKLNFNLYYECSVGQIQCVYLVVMFWWNCAIYGGNGVVLPRGLQ